MSNKLIGTILVIFIFYLLGSFIAASFNPVDWWLLGRIIFGFLTLIVIINYD